MVSSVEKRSGLSFALRESISSGFILLLWRSWSSFLCGTLLAADGQGLEHDSKATVNYIHLTDLGISLTGFRWNEVSAIGLIDIDLFAVVLQEPEIFVAKEFLDFRLLFGRQHADVRRLKSLRERLAQTRPHAVVVDAGEKVRIFREYMEKREIQAGISGLLFKTIRVCRQSEQLEKIARRILAFQQIGNQKTDPELGRWQGLLPFLHVDAEGGPPDLKTLRNEFIE